MFDDLGRAKAAIRPHDTQRAKGSRGVPDDVLIRFYKDCYHDLRAEFWARTFRWYSTTGSGRCLWKNVFPPEDYTRI